PPVAVLAAFRVLYPAFLCLKGNITMLQHHLLQPVRAADQAGGQLAMSSTALLSRNSCIN
ncbi:hypothetical protein ACVXHA_26095, partial [Escherichia coli]